jgi:hypothetical protein
MALSVVDGTPYSQNIRNLSSNSAYARKQAILEMGDRGGEMAFD